MKNQILIEDSMSRFGASLRIAGGNDVSQSGRSPTGPIANRAEVFVLPPQTLEGSVEAFWGSRLACKGNRQSRWLTPPCSEWYFNRFPSASVALMLEAFSMRCSHQRT